MIFIILDYFDITHFRLCFLNESYSFILMYLVKFNVLLCTLYHACQTQIRVGPHNDIYRLKNCQRAAVWKYSQLFKCSEAFSYQNMSVLSILKRAKRWQRVKQSNGTKWKRVDVNIWKQSIMRLALSKISRIYRVAK